MKGPDYSVIMKTISFLSTLYSILSADITVLSFVKITTCFDRKSSPGSFTHVIFMHSLNYNAAELACFSDGVAVEVIAIYRCGFFLAFKIKIRTTDYNFS
jgi:hypothetical protein